MMRLKYVGGAHVRIMSEEDVLRSYGCKGSVDIDARVDPYVTVSNKFAGHLLTSGEFVLSGAFGDDDPDSEETVATGPSPEQIQANVDNPVTVDPVVTADAGKGSATTAKTKDTK